ncbi:uncharacterized protein LOC106882262 [Octopus bimaculoides]|uniref:Uncharacterized protein n=1 Tax=Octopus bimaculoides TaxID=37653 RepID=A0A0L8FNC1_OCTBM|nr:uncharacterized protein LOC106882262 [Octopus bimaculoides]XP_052832383.1 uncharacterized protein LOC106882262 [Octopus bimaculoides]|eukprot:XP_014788360.1 PREDICTED: uncharacterized protein LOC106882262 [Octopus bimaculoides]
MTEQVSSQYLNNGMKDGHIALQEQPILQPASTTKPDSDVEARVNQFMQTTGRSLQGQYWRRSAFELSKWLTAQIQYERQGWQLKLQTALKEIESYRKEALIADKILTDSLQALLNCLETCSINYTKKVISVNKKKNIFIEYVDLLTELLQFLIQERLQCLCLMERKPDIKVNLVECIHQFLESELKSAKQVRSQAIKQEQELRSIITELKKDKENFQKMALYSSWITTNKIQKDSNTVKKYKKYSVEPTINLILSNTSSNNNGRVRSKQQANRSQITEHNSSINNVTSDLLKEIEAQESLTCLSNMQTDKNGKTFTVSNQINLNEITIKPNKIAHCEYRTVREGCDPTEEPVGNVMKAQYNLPPIKVWPRQIRVRRLST